jgi:pilus assembly protein CpaF
VERSLRDRLLGRKSPAPDGGSPSGPNGTDPIRPPSVGETDPMAGIPQPASQKAEADAAGPSPVDLLKRDLHQKLVERLDLAALEKIRDANVLTQQIRTAVLEFLRIEQAPLSASERDEVVEQIVWEVTGLGPIEPLTKDGTVADILVNGPKSVYVERKGRLEKTNITFRDNAHLLTIIDRIVSKVGRRVDESSPMVDARLEDGSRVNAIIPPLAIDGPVLSIRRFGASLGPRRLIELGAISPPMMRLLAACVASRLNILVSGGTGSGKTTMLNALSSFIPEAERLVTIEDAAELRLQQAHVVRLETRPPNTEGRGEVSARDLVKNALRMRPDRIILGEVRSGEALDMLQAMNTGHEGSLATIHANTPRDALARLETMVLFAGTALPPRAIREQMASALNLIVQVSRMSDGTRRVTSITEISTMESDVITSQEIFRYHRRGVADDGTVLGGFEATGVRPTFMDQIAARGIHLPPDLFAFGAKSEAGLEAAGAMVAAGMLG